MRVVAFSYLYTYYIFANGIAAIFVKMILLNNFPYVLRIDVSAIGIKIINIKRIAFENTRTYYEYIQFKIFYSNIFYRTDCIQYAGVGNPSIDSSPYRERILF